MSSQSKFPQKLAALQPTTLIAHVKRLGTLCFASAMAEESQEIIEFMEKNMGFSREFINDCKEARRSVGQISNMERDHAREAILKANASGYEEHIATPFSALNACLSGGFLPGQLIVLGSRPGMGKTTLAIDIGSHIGLQSEKVVAFFSLELTAELFGKRLLSHCAGTSLELLDPRNENELDWISIANAGKKLSTAGVFLDDSAELFVSQILDKCEALKKERGRLDLVVVDYLQLMSGESQTSERFYGSREEEISRIVRGLKVAAKNLNCPILALSQLNRGLENRPDKRPNRSDLRECEAIFSDSDIVMFLYRDAYYDPETEARDVAEVIIAKNRTGSCGTAKLRYQSKIPRFSELVPQNA